jgi:preprotein translocase subunit SecF
MKTLLVLVVLLLAGIAGLGFYRGWFRLSTNSADQKPSATITVDKEKIHADEEQAREKVQGLGQKVKDKTSDLTDKVTQ